MRKPLESTLEKRCVALARERGWKVKKLNTLFDNHWPDRMFVRPRRSSSVPIFFVEFKRKGEKPTPMQARTITDLKQRGQIVFVVDTYEKFLAVLRRCS